ncbi:sugar-binding transcriptional regulator [Aureimonas sp. ME7]|uniref:sugar-binding transcriptional regulator n=1 Tax=Aureimonas sp. ME7 TaxID=2744252 RepID=UPI0015F50227|nr:sugar-binding transcriptional regulator [Aureimonas sp. ME7]
MSRATEDAGGRLDDAARAGWLYYIAGKTQEEIAAQLGISRQGAQRLVSLSVSAGLVKVRIDHPIAACLELGRRLQDRFALTSVEVVPSDETSPSTTLGIAEACASRIERTLLQAEPLVIGIGTGRTLRAAVENLPRIRCPQHRLVSLTGNIAPDGSAAVYNVIFSLADKIDAAHYPMPLPVVASSPGERSLLHQQKVVQISLQLARQADIAFVGIGEVGPQAQLLMDRFISESERDELVATGGIGEIVGWVYDRDGHILDCAFNKRVVSAPFPLRKSAEVVGVAMGEPKRESILAALSGGLVDSLITDEQTAIALLSSETSSAQPVSKFAATRGSG